MNGTENCVICGKELPVDMTQILLDLKGNSACLQHEGSKELYTWRIKHQKQENVQLQAQAARMREALEAILREFDDFGNRRDGVRAYEALDMAKAALSDTPADYHNPADVEALRKENEQLQAQVAQYREAVEVLETVTEHLENCYGRNTPDTEKAREALAAIDKIGGRE